MEIYKHLKEEEKGMLVCVESRLAKLENVAENVVIRTTNEIMVSDEQQDSKDLIYVQLPTNGYSDELVSKLLHINKPGTELLLEGISDKVEIEFILKTNGYINIRKDETNSLIRCEKPKYKIGSSAKLNFKKPAVAVWKIDNDDEEIIDPDNLLDDEDLQKPDPSSLKVCGTTGKRKACKDCSCGLAEELAVEIQKGTIIDTDKAPKSSCGSCYLGDAFRCAACPYLGMPAFKKGEKIQLSDNLLKSDL